MDRRASDAVNRPRERTFKEALIHQAQFAPGQRVLDLATDTGTLAIAARKARRAGVVIRFEREPSFVLPYPDAHFHRVVSSLFFHHLSWQEKVATTRELVRALFLMIRCLDGFESTRDNAAGRLVALFEQAGLREVAERARFSAVFGTLALYSAARAPSTS